MSFRGRGGRGRGGGGGRGGWRGRGGGRGGYHQDMGPPETVIGMTCEYVNFKLFMYVHVYRNFLTSCLATECRL